MEDIQMGKCTIKEYDAKDVERHSKKFKERTTVVDGVHPRHFALMCEQGKLATAKICNMISRIFVKN